MEKIVISLALAFVTILCTLLIFLKQALNMIRSKHAHTKY